MECVAVINGGAGGQHTRCDASLLTAYFTIPAQYQTHLGLPLNRYSFKIKSKEKDAT